jgi:hypothetical protein
MSNASLFIWLQLFVADQFFVASVNGQCNEKHVAEPQDVGERRASVAIASLAFSLGDDHFHADRAPELRHRLTERAETDDSQNSAAQDR